MTASLPHVAHEHREHLLRQIDRMPETGDMLGTASPAEIRGRLDETYVFLTEVLIPHIEAAERELYPELERMLQSVHSMAPLRREHDEVRRSTAELARIQVLVDDVYTTGATTQEVSRVLAAGTGVPVYVFTFSRAVSGGGEGHD